MNHKGLYKTFPPGHRNILLMRDDKHSAIEGLALYSPVRYRGRLARFLARAALRLGGPRLLPGRSLEGLPLDVFSNGGEIRQLVRALYGEYDGEAANSRRPPHSPGGTALLMRGGSPWLFLKIGSRSSVEREWEALSLLHARRSEDSPFLSPTPLSHHHLTHVSVLVTEPLPLDKDRPSLSPPLARIVRSIRSSLCNLRRGAGVPHHWQPAHGDLSPWNIRESGPRIYIVDWEEARYAPPLADQLYFHLTRSAVRHATIDLDTSTYREAADYWRTVFSHRPESTLKKRVLELLDRF